MDLQAFAGQFWPYLIILVVGFLPTEIWRVLAVYVAKDLRQDSELLQWVRLVASTLLAAVVAKIVIAPPGLLAQVPLWGRIASLVVAGLALFASRKSVGIAVLAGEAVLITAFLLFR